MQVHPHRKANRSASREPHPLLLSHNLFTGTTEPPMSSVPFGILRLGLETEENIFSSKIESLNSIIELIETDSLALDQGANKLPYKPPTLSTPAGRPFRCVSDISELWLQEHWDMLVVTSGDARSCDWVLNQTYELSNIIVDVFEYHFQIGNQSQEDFGRPAAASRGGGTGRRVGSKGRRVRKPRRRNVKPTGEPEGQENDQSVEVTKVAIKEIIETEMEMYSMNTFKEYDGKGSTIVYTRWIEKMELVQDMSRCGDAQKSREVAIGMAWDDLKVLMREEFCPSNEIQKLETDYGTTSRSGLSNVAYTNRFHEWLSGSNGANNDSECCTKAGVFNYLMRPLEVSNRSNTEREEMVFPDDLSRLPPIQEIKFQIELIPRAILVVNFPYRLAPSKIEELSGQLRELQDKGFIRPSSSPWGAPGEERKNAFQSLKDKLCNAPVLALPDRLEDFMIGLFGDYDCEIRYHLGKANVVVDALSRKERVKPKRVRAMNMTLQSSIKDKILAAQKEASDEFAGLQKGIDKMIKCSSDGALYYLDL
ncbi:hypothetical protein Tco_0164416 [Tanacetum coccineum]